MILTHDSELGTKPCFCLANHWTTAHKMRNKWDKTTGPVINAQKWLKDISMTQLRSLLYYLGMDRLFPELKITSKKVLIQRQRWFKEFLINEYRRRI